MISSKNKDGNIASPQTKSHFYGMNFSVIKEKTFAYSNASMKENSSFMCIAHLGAMNSPSANWNSSINLIRKLDFRL